MSISRTTDKTIAFLLRCYEYDYQYCVCVILCEVYQVAVHLGLSIEVVHKAMATPLYCTFKHSG